ncbi:MAG: NADP-dependent 3-hydroxy acid dehydrogenase YdfG/Tfp pilus assembly protein PilF [Granulosicoccus sp.]|jgi:NADP-dependent 3-hydroxy acid dehydrogenase YdfG/Tfp pilus assembly protein PilF
MNNHKFHLAYSSDNQDIAQEIDNHLTRVGIELDHINISHQTSETSLQERFKTSPYFVFILVSTNFLKNVNCMTRSLFMLQELTMNNRVQPIIIDGREQIEGTNSFENMPTEFDRMTHVIRYMNFWQDQYLDLRKERRKTPTEKLDTFDEHLKVIRSISSEMSDFLKLLKNSNYWTFKQLTHNGYELFFQGIFNPGLHDALKQAIANGEIPQVSAPLASPTPVAITPAPPIEAPAEEEIEEESSLVNILLLDDEPAEIIAEQIEKTVEEPLEEDFTTESIPEETTDTNQPHPIDIPSFTPQIVQNNDDELLRISEENIKKKGKVPLLDKLIEHRKKDFQLEEQPIEIEENIVPNEEIPPEDTVQELSDLTPVEREDKDDVFENAINKVIEEENQIEVKNQKTESTKSNVRSHPILDEIFHDDDDELDSDDMIGSFTLSNSSSPKPEKKEEKKEEVKEEVKLTWQEQLKKANSLIEDGKLHAGLNLMREISEENDENVILKYEYASKLLEGGENNKAARRELEKIITLDPNHLDAYLQLSALANKKGDYLLSKSYLEKVLELDEKNADLLYQLGVLTTTKFPDLQDQAAHYFKLSIKIDDSNPDVHYRYGLILDEHLKKPKKALRQFEITKELQDNHRFVSYDLALMYYRFGEFKKAAKYYHQACKINPELKTETNDRAFLGAIESNVNAKATSNLDDRFQDLSEPSIKKQEAAISKNRIEKDNSTITFTDEAPQRNENFDKVVLITGATSGIGKATATIFARNGYRLILTGRRSDRLADIKADFEKNYPTEVQTLEFDVRKIDDAQAAIASLPEEFNSIDLLINNAGLAKGFEPIHEGKLEDWETMIDTNVKGLLYMTRIVSPGMVARQKGHIINICSTAGHEVYPKGNVYCASKHAVDALTKGMRLDLYKHGLRVSQVSPAHVEETEFAKVRFDGDEERAKIYEDFQPLRAEDVANTIYFIATQPAHVNIQDVMMMGRQQANSSNLDRSGR